MVAAMPNTTESTVIKAKAVMAPVKTTKRGWRIAIMAAMKNVLSPNSVNKITEMDAVNASKNPVLTGEPLVESAFCMAFSKSD